MNLISDEEKTLNSMNNIEESVSNSLKIVFMIISLICFQYVRIITIENVFKYF